MLGRCGTHSREKYAACAILKPGGGGTRHTRHCGGLVPHKKQGHSEGAAETGEADVIQRALKNGPEERLVWSRRGGSCRPLGERTRAQRAPRVAARRACGVGSTNEKLAFVYCPLFGGPMKNWRSGSEQTTPGGSVWPTRGGPRDLWTYLNPPSMTLLFLFFFCNYFALPPCSPSRDTPHPFR